MDTSDRIDSFIQQAKKLFPSESFPSDIEKNLRTIAQNAFNKLDIVTKEEFDAQVDVLKRANEKIDGLEKQLLQLTELFNEQNNTE